MSSAPSTTRSGVLRLAIPAVLLANVALVTFFDLEPWRSLRATLQNNIGYAYWRGVVVGADADAATAWFRRAVGNGSPEAANNLANLLEDGPRGATTRSDLIGLYLQAARGGIGLAQNNLGVLLLDDDPKRAEYWFEIASRSRDPVVAMQAEENLRRARAATQRAATKDKPRRRPSD